MSNIPTHIGFIIDGNRRWAKARGLKPYEGHYAGYDAIKDVLIEAHRRGVKYTSAFVFSTENWGRSSIEINKLMDLLVKVLTDDLHIFNEENIKLKVIGTRERLSKKVIQAIDNAESQTAANDGGELLMCLNYGGQLEIAKACQKIVQQGIPASDITPELIAQNLYAPDVPPCDMIVRTSGEQRLSGFMLWRAAYSELMFIQKNWPDMTKEDVTVILNEYENRNRRFGG